MALILDRSTPLTLAEMMGTIMTSIVNAQAESARATVEFINEVGFITDPEDDKEKLRSVQFGYKKLDENNEVSDFTIDIPLLGMVNIPMVSVKKATFSFSYEITNAEPSKKPKKQSTTAIKSLSMPTKMALIKGRIAKKSAPGQERANLEVSVELERPPTPVGVDRILDILEVAATSSKDNTDENGG